MRGLKITFCGKTIEIAAEFGINVFVHQRNTHFHVSVSGLEIKSKGDMITHKWIDSDMQPEDSIEIEIVETQKNLSDQSKIETTFSNPIVLTENEIEDMFAEKLNNFHALEKLLKNEGLI